MRQDSPDHIGRYTILSRLGQGGMGTVYRAQDPLLGRILAIKVLSVSNPELLGRFSREARSVASLQHEHIVTVYDVGEDNGQPFIAMEYVDGESLADLIRRTPPLAVERKLQFVLELCEGLGYAHRRGIVHRDIKPANLMVTSEGTIKILDFGLARLTDDSAQAGLTQAGWLLGTPYYMAPEQIEGRPADQRSDLFATGLVLYELLAYQKPFTANTPHAIMHAIVHADPRPLAESYPDVDPELEQVVLRALHKSPEHRYQSLSLLAADLSRIVERIRARSSEQTVVLPGPPQSSPRPRTPAPSAASHGPKLDDIARRRAAQLDDHISRAKGLLETGQLREAIEQCEAALWLDPEEPRALDLLRRAEEARESLQVADWLQLANKYLRSGALTEAQGLVEQCLELRPDSNEGRQLERAVRESLLEQERVRERERSIEALLVQARALLGNGACESALAACAEVLALDSRNVEALEIHRAATLELDRRMQARKVEEQVQEVLALARQNAADQRHLIALQVLRDFGIEHPLVDQAKADIARQFEEFKEQRRLEAERIARERAEEERQRLEAEQRAEAERQRLEAEQRAEAERQRLEAEQRAEEERQRLEAEQHAEAERQRLEAEQRAEAERQRLEAEQRAEAERQRLEAEQRAEAERQRLEAEQRAEAERQRLEAEQRAEAERQRLEAEQRAEAERQRLEAEQRAEAERQRLEAEQRAEEERQRLEAKRRADEEEHKRLEAERRAVEKRHRLEAKRLAEEERQRLEAERRADKERQRLEAKRRAEEERQQLEVERRAEEERQRLEVERRAEEERQQLEVERRAEEERQQLEVERRAEEERQQLEVDRRAEEERQRLVAERRADKERQRLEAERRAEEERQRLEVDRRAEEERQRLEVDRRAEEERQRLEAERRAEAKAVEAPLPKRDMRPGRTRDHHPPRQPESPGRETAATVEAAHDGPALSASSEPAPFIGPQATRARSFEPLHRYVAVAVVLAAGLLVAFMLLRPEDVAPPQPNVKDERVSPPVEGTPKPPVTILAAQAARAFEDGKLEVAIDLAMQTLQQDPENREVAQLVERMRSAAAEAANGARRDADRLKAGTSDEYRQAVEALARGDQLASPAEVKASLTAYYEARRLFGVAASARVTTAAQFFEMARTAKSQEAAIDYALEGLRIEPNNAPLLRFLDNIRKAAADSAQQARGDAIRAGVDGNSLALGDKQAKQAEALRSPTAIKSALQAYTAARQQFEAATELLRDRQREAQREGNERQRRITTAIDAAREHLKLGRFDDADQRVTEALGLDPKNADALALRGRISQGRKDRDRQLLERTEVANALKRAASEPNAQQRLNVLSEALTRFPGNPDLLTAMEAARKEIPTPTPVPPKRADDATDIINTFERWRSGMNQLDAAAVAAEYPSTRARIGAVLNEYRSQQLDVVSRGEPSIEGTTAQLECRIHWTLQTKASQRSETTQTYRIQFRKMDGRWSIATMQVR